MRIVALEERFDSLPNDVAELHRRDQVIRYAIMPLVGHYAEFLTGISRASKDDCVFSPKCLNNLQTLLKIMRKFLGSFKIYRRSFSIIRFVRNHRNFVDVNMVVRWHRNLQRTRKCVKQLLVFLLYV